jgi:hypothetical protein
MALQPIFEHCTPLYWELLSHTFRRTVGLLWTSDQPVTEASTYTELRLRGHRDRLYYKYTKLVLGFFLWLWNATPAGPSGLAVWGAGLDCLDTEIVSSNPA